MPTHAGRIASRASARLHRLEGRRFDRRWGLETEVAVEPPDHDVVGRDAAAGFTYVATPIRLGLWVLRAYPCAPGSTTFVDLGSGKARMLVLASLHGYRSAVGVEYATSLHETATANVAAFERRHGVTGIELAHADAGAYGFPAEPLAVYFNNPFADRVMERVLANLERSYRQSPRPVAVVYQQLRDEDACHRTRNEEQLEALTFLARQHIRPRTLLSAFVLRPFRLSLFASPETVSGSYAGGSVPPQRQV